MTEDSLSGVAFLLRQCDSTARAKKEGQKAEVYPPLIPTILLEN